METRLFYVVDSTDSNEEIFETFEEAKDFEAKLLSQGVKPRIAVSMVKNAYREDSGAWNYEDTADTFDVVRYV